MKKIGSLCLFAMIGVTVDAYADDKKLPLLDSPGGTESIKVTIEDAPAGTLGNKHVFNGFGCTGENQSPALKWTGAPKDTKSFAIVVHDPDAPTGVGFFHWIVANLPPTTSALPAGANKAMPASAVQGFSDFGVSAYGGPCPPPGAPHRYVFTVYALKVPKLEVNDKATGAVMRFMLRDASIAYGRAVATYGRK